MNNDGEYSVEIKEQIKMFIVSDLTGQPSLVIGDDEDLLLSGLVDSLGVVRLIAFLEEQTSVNIPPGEVTIENFGTVSAMVNYLGTKVLE
jgi:acyl carrier protein